MIQIITNGIKAGVIAGLFWGLLNVFFVSPLILKAETYEGTAHVHADGHHHHHGEEFSPEGKTRSALTILGTTLLGVAYGVLLSLVIVLALKFNLITTSFAKNSGVLTALMGISAFAILHGLPSLGLPPPLPGVENSEGDFGVRQNWWLFSVFMNFCAIMMFWFGSKVLQRYGISKGLSLSLSVALAIFFIWAPFGLYGVPDHSLTTSVPKDLQEQFLGASLFVNLAFWIILSFTSLKLDDLTLKKA
jgi:cobalt transporter subunit CbtA